MPCRHTGSCRLPGFLCSDALAALVFISHKPSRAVGNRRAAGCTLAAAEKAQKSTRRGGRRTKEGVGKMGPIVTAMLRGMLPRDAHIAHSNQAPARHRRAWVLWHPHPTNLGNDCEQERRW